MRWDREKLPQPNLHVYGKNGTKIMVYNIKRCPKRKRSKKEKKEGVEEIQNQKEKLEILGYTILARLRTILYLIRINTLPNHPRSLRLF